MPAVARSAPPERMLRVVIADPHPTVRRAFRALLSCEPQATVVDDVPDLRAAGAAVRRGAADVLVVDDRLFVADRGLLGPIPATTAVVVAGMDDDPGMAAHYESRGAAAYVLKDEAHLRLPPVLVGLQGG